MSDPPYWPKPKRFFLVLGRGGVFVNRIRRAFGIQWRGGFIGILITEKEDSK